MLINICRPVKKIVTISCFECINLSKEFMLTNVYYLYLRNKILLIFKPKLTDYSYT